MAWVSRTELALAPWPRGVVAPRLAEINAKEEAEAQQAQLQGRGVIFHQKNMGISMVIFLIIKLLYV